MADEPTIVIPLDIQMPLSQVQAIVRSYLLTQLTRPQNGTRPVSEEEAAPVVAAAATGAP